MTRSMSASANSAATSTPRVRRLAAARRHRSRRVFERHRFRTAGACSAGQIPKSRPVASDKTKREAEHAPVDAGVNGGRHAGRDQLQQRDDQRARGQEAERAAGERQHDAFGQKLPEEPAATGAEGHPHRELARARRGADEQQIRDVRARDEQHRADRTDEHDERRPDGPRQILLQRHDARAPAERVGIVGLDGRSEVARRARRCAARGGVDRDAGAQPSNRASQDRGCRRRADCETACP